MAKHEEIKSKNQEELSQKENDPEKGGDEDSIIPEELLEQIPKEERGKVVSIIRQTMFSGIMGRRNPIADKISGEHITKMIDESAKDSEREYKEKKNQRWFVFGVILIGTALLIFLTLYLAKDNETTFMNILIPILAFLGGMGAGYGISKKPSVCQ